jgi:hypothetical protein
MNQKKPYISPDIVRVQLVFEEAVLTACKRLKKFGPYTASGAAGCVDFTKSPIECFEAGT